MDSRKAWDPEIQAQAIVVGAGAVGMYTALLLARRGCKVILVERRRSILKGSRAIGISPSSLDALRLLGLDRDFVNAGLGIRRVQVFGRRGLLGRVSFDQIPASYPFILSLPQEDYEHILLEAVRKQEGIQFLSGFEAIALDSHPSSGHYRIGIRPAAEQEAGEGPIMPDPRPREGSSNSGAQPEFWISAPLICASDGSNSSMRSLAGRAFPGHFYIHSFVMGDFVDHSGFGQEARLFFTTQGAIESFPLPNGRRRWIAQTPKYHPDPDPGLISRLVKERIGLMLDPNEPEWMSPFAVRRNRIDRYYQFADPLSGRGLLVFLGDAAHLMSPIGGQGMNTGISDAMQLVDALGPFPQKEVDTGWLQTSLRQWESRRIRAYRAAANRAWKSMSLGTVIGTFPSLLRDGLLWLMLNGPGKAQVPIDYAMLSIPHRQVGLERLATSLMEPKAGA